MIREVIADGCCPLHLRLQLSRALSGHGCRPREAIEHPLSVQNCSLEIMSFLPQKDILAVRATGVDQLCSAMQRPLHGQEELTIRPPHRGIIEVHERIRCRLWLRRLEKLTAGMPDETVFETSVRSFVDANLQRRLVAELEDAKSLMDEKVRQAKLTMLQGVQEVTEQVDLRVRASVARLQEEFDVRVSEQARDLQAMVERRVSEQTQALQVEVNRRTAQVREVVEQHAKQQEEAASKLHAEVAHIREMLESRLQEQEGVALRLGMQLADTREALELRVSEQEAIANRLLKEITTLQNSCNAD